MTLLKDFQKPKAFFTRTIWNFTHYYKKNFIMVISGGVGEGKSFAAIKIGELVDPKFSIDKVAYTPREFMDAVGNVKHTGEVIIWDEAGVGLPAREWHSVSNKVINYVIQTFRKDKACVIFVTPDLSFIDVQARKLVRAFCEAKRYRMDSTKLWVYRMSINRRTGDIYYPHPLYKTNGNIHKLKYAVIKLPSPELIKQYEEKANKWKDNIKRDVVKSINIMERKSGATTIYDYINKVQNEKKKFMRNNKFNTYLIMTKLGISEVKARQIRTMLA